jgi:hypothetical protein
MTTRRRNTPGSSIHHHARRQTTELLFRHIANELSNTPVSKMQAGSKGNIVNFTRSTDALDLLE